MRFKLDKNGVASYELRLLKRMEEAKKILAADIFEDLKLFSPVRTGKLRSSYTIAANARSIEISNDCGYCQYVNNGTVYQAGQHFVERAIVDALAKFQRKGKEISNK